MAQVQNNNEGDNKVSLMKQALPQIIAVSVKNLILFAFGTTFGYPTLLIPGVNDVKEDLYFDADGLSWIGSILTICVPIGCVISGTMSQVFGRRRSMQLVNIPYITGWLLIAFCDTEWQIYLALAIFGLTGGSLEAPILTYVAEVTQPHIRGILSAVSVACFFIGIMTVFILGMLLRWRTIAFLCIFIHIIAFAALFFIPESPHWLIQKGRFAEARESLAWLRGWVKPSDVEEEYQMIEGEVLKDEGREKRSAWEYCRMFLGKSFLWPYTLVCFVFLLSHFCGMSPLLAYAVPVFNTLKVPMDEFYATALTGVVQLLGCIPNCTLINVLGKRVLNFISLIAMGVCTILLGIYAHTQNILTLTLPIKNTTHPEATKVVIESNPYSWMPLTLIIIFTFFAHVGVKQTPWVLVGEVFSTDLRAPAAGICSATTYILNFFVNKTFFTSVADLTLPGVFWMYSCVSFLGCIILYFVQPETEGKTLSEIAEHFAGGKNMGKHVNRRKKKSERESVKFNGMTSVDLGNVNEAYNHYGDKVF